jgi:protein-arginine kinase activator protein McsA
MLTLAFVPCRLREQIERILTSDAALSKALALEMAIEDGRVEEAARLRDELRALRQAQQLSSRELSDF